MKKFFFFILVIVLYSDSEASQTIEYWVKDYGGHGRLKSIQQTSDGGYILLGNTRYYNTDEWENVRVLKLDSNGSMVWDKMYGGEYYDYARSIQETPDGGYIVSVLSGESKRYAVVLKLDSDGNVVWQKRYGYDVFDCFIRSVADGGYMLVERVSVPLRDNLHRIIAIKLDSDGTVVWQKLYGQECKNYSPYFFQPTSDRGFLILMNDSCKVLKINENGDVEWAKRYGRSYSDHAYSIQETKGGGYIVAGTAYVAGSQDFWVLNLDDEGNILWQKTYGNDANDENPHVLATSDGGYILAGNTAFQKQDVLMLKLDSNGNIIWQRIYGWDGSEWLASVEQTPDGGYILAVGESYLHHNMLKVDCNGEIPGCDLISNASVLVTTPSFGIEEIYTVPSSYSLYQRDTTNWPAQEITEEITEMCGGSQIDFDEDGYSDVCDNCPELPNSPEKGTCISGSIGLGCMNDSDCGVDGRCDMNQEDSDGDSIGTLCDMCPDDPENDLDGDAICGDVDNCPYDAENDSDSDTICGDVDNCLYSSNFEQMDSDTDGVGDVCDNCLATPNADQRDSYPSGGNGIGDFCDDIDEDSIVDVQDNCPTASNIDQEDHFPPQGNAIGNTCDCEGDFICDGDVDGTDAALFKRDFGRGFSNACRYEVPCNGDFDCDEDVDGTDAALFKSDFGRNSISNPCPACTVGDWCSY